MHFRTATQFVQPIACFLLALLASPSFANATERIAFVVGNDNYSHGTKLKNAVSDARLMSITLKKCGFEVIALENAGIEKFYEGLDRFNRIASSADVGLLYYAGHGIEVDGDNFLLPTDAKLETRSQLRTQAVGLNTVLRDMEDANLPVKLAILDCCRDNPLSRSWMISRSGTRGGLGELGDESLPEVSMVMYSARPGQVAFDGDFGNSPFSLALAGRLATPGLNVFDAFYKTADDVMRATGDRQEPWVKADGSAQAIRRLVFVPNAGLPPKPIISPEAEVQIGSSKWAPDPSVVGNNNSSTPELEMKKTPIIEGPPAIPTRGYFSTEDVFTDSPYEGFNSYSRSKILRSAQTKLPGAGSADGAMGPMTQSAILSFQASRSLRLTGLLDAATLLALELMDITEEKPKYTKNTGSSGRSYSGGSRKRSGGGSLEGRAAGAAARAVLGF